jgi:hypothetical protein
MQENQVDVVGERIGLVVVNTNQDGDDDSTCSDVMTI